MYMCPLSHLTNVYGSVDRILLWAVVAHFGVLPWIISVVSEILPWHVGMCAGRQRRMLDVVHHVRARPPPVPHLLCAGDKRDLKPLPAR